MSSPIFARILGFRCSPCASSEIMQHRSSVKTEPVTSTVDHADIRGLGTTLLVSVGCLPRSRHEGLSQPHNVHEGCTLTGAAPPPRIDVAPIQLSRDSAIVSTPPWPAP